MDMIPVESEAISHVGYDPTSATMRIRFKHGGTYEYGNVHPDKHQGLISAESIGGHFQKHIRPHHVGVKVG